MATKTSVASMVKSSSLLMHGEQKALKAGERGIAAMQQSADRPCAMLRRSLFRRRGARSLRTGPLRCRRSPFGSTGTEFVRCEARGKAACEPRLFSALTWHLMRASSSNFCKERRYSRLQPPSSQSQRLTEHAPQARKHKRRFKQAQAADPLAVFRGCSADNRRQRFQ